MFLASSPLVSPRLPDKILEPNTKYTLILDLDETLLHTEWLKANPERYVVHERPYVREVLRSIKQLPVEVVIFTAGIQEYADTVINIMDQDTKTIGHRLYRQHTTSNGFQRWKDLTLLNRNLSKTLIVDNTPEVFSQHPNNGIVISSWEGHLSLVNTSNERKRFQSVDDRALIHLFYWLEYLCSESLMVPEFVKMYRDQIRFALGYSNKQKSPIDYQPPFPLGKLSKDLLLRCGLTIPTFIPRPLKTWRNNSTMTCNLDNYNTHYGVKVLSHTPYRDVSNNNDRTNKFLSKNFLSPTWSKFIQKFKKTETCNRNDNSFEKSDSNTMISLHNLIAA